MNLRETLVSLCYREVKDSVWAKPVGYHLFTVREKIMRWENWFRSISGELLVYDAHSIAPFEDRDHLSMIKGCEAYARINAGDGYGTSQFELGSKGLWDNET